MGELTLPRTIMKKVFIPGLGERKKDYKYIPYCYPIDWNNPKLNFKNVDILVAFSMGCVLAINHASKYKVGTLILCSMPSFNFDKTKIKADKIHYLYSIRHRFNKKYLKTVEKLCPELLKEDK